MTTKIPLQGTPGVLDPRNPTLVPNFDTTVASGAGTVDQFSPEAFDQANPRTAAVVTATIGGTITNGDTITTTLTQGALPGGSISHEITVVTADTTTTIAEKIAAAWGDDDIAEQFNIEVTAAGAVVTFSWEGPMANVATLSYVVGGSATETVTLSPAGGAFSGGSGPVYAYNNFQYSYGGTIINFRAGQPEFCDPGLVAALATNGMPVV